MAKYNLHDFNHPSGAKLHAMTLGRGPWKVTVIPGAGDGQETLDRSAWRLGLYFGKRIKDFSLLVLSRRQPIPPDFTLEQHAEDMIWLIEKMGWGASVLETNSAGGPIGQWMAVKRPGWVKGLILSCTLHRSNPVTQAVLNEWISQAQKGQWNAFTWSSIEHTFRQQTVRQYRLFRPFLGLIARPPKQPERMINTLRGLLDFDNSPLLPKITCPSLVMGGKDDQVIPAEIQAEMAGLLPNSRLILYDGYGHGNDQENPQYEVQVRKFLQEIG